MVKRVFGSTADDVQTGQAGDEEKIRIYTAVMCAVGGTIVFYVFFRIVMALYHRRHGKSPQISPSESEPKSVPGDLDSESRFAEESKDVESSLVTPSKPKRKMRIKLARGGGYTMTVSTIPESSTEQTFARFEPED